MWPGNQRAKLQKDFGTPALNYDFPAINYGPETLLNEKPLNNVHNKCNPVNQMTDPLSYFSFQPVLNDWCNKGCGMCYPVGKSSPCGGSWFPLLLSEWDFTISLTPHNRK